MALKGIRVIEMAGLAPVPFCGMLLADFGASVIRVDKIDTSRTLDCLARHKRSISINLKTSGGIDVVKTLCKQADVLLEPFRPTVMEKLGLGPDVLLQANPSLIYARLTGYGQSSKMSHKAGHDINYLAVSGVLSLLGRQKENPVPPINLLADFAGGGLMCAFGVLVALLERSRTGKGQVVDTGMVHGAAYLSTFLKATMQCSANKHYVWGGERGTNLLDTGAPFYECYRTADGKYMAVGAIEPKFYENLLRGLEIDVNGLSAQNDRKGWSRMKERFTKAFASRTRDEWCKIFENLDACVTPVLTMEEAETVNEDAFDANAEGVMLPTVTPRLNEKSLSFSQTKQNLLCGMHTKEILLEAGISSKEIDVMLRNNTVKQATEQCSEQSKL